MPRVSEDHLAARRRQILDGARRCFAEYGYDKATVRRLEQAIGLSRGAIFHHFRDKDTLFFELARQDAARMAETAAQEGLIRVMRDLLAAPEQFDWLATRLEIARKLRNDPEFHRGWTEHAAQLSAATTDRLNRQKQAGRLRSDVSRDVLHCYLDVVLDGLVARLAAGEDPQRLSKVLDVVENSLRYHPDNSIPITSAKPANPTARQAQSDLDSFATNNLQYRLEAEPPAAAQAPQLPPDHE